MVIRKREELFAFDLDGTLLKSSISILFYKYAIRRFLLPWSSLFRCFFLYCNFKIFCNLSSFHHKIFQRVFFNQSLAELSRIGERFVKEHNWKKELYMPAYNKLKYAQSKGAYTAIFSSSPDFLVKKIAKLFNVDFVLASSYVCNEQGKCSRIFNLVDGYLKKKV